VSNRGNDNGGGSSATRGRRVFVAILVPMLLVVAAIAALAVVQRPWVGLYNYVRHGKLTVAPAPAPPTVALPMNPVGDSAPMPTSAGLVAALRQAAANPALGTFAATVSDARTGTALWERDPDRPMVPASSTKIFTAAAALLSLPLDHRLTTRVVRGATPNELVLVGGGDPTITAAAAGAPTIYPGAAHLDDLVAQIRNATGGATGVDTVVVDTSAYTGPTVAPGWDPADIAGGDYSPMESVMIDGGRLRPLEQDSPRTPTAALDAGRALARKLGIDPAHVRLGGAPAGAQQVAAVQSAPLVERLRQALVNSDNVLAEAIAREVAVNAGAPASFAGAVAAEQNILRQAGFDLTGVTLNDSNGLSTADRIPPRLLGGIVAAAAGAREPKLRPLLDSVPVAGATGTLADRFTTVNRIGAGWVRAKTGTLSGANALVGFVVDADNRVLAFALMSNGTSPDAGRPALDAVAAAMRSCGCR
jgi:D-alanyl-D-alanine carboxypeptidase/D-alanyl-D-alanine-endopeptidase (penicillin-binding protein 4)